MEPDEFGLHVGQNHRMAAVNIPTIDDKGINPAKEHVARSKEPLNVTERRRPVYQSNAALADQRSGEFLFLSKIRKAPLFSEDFSRPESPEVLFARSRERFISESAADINDLNAAARQVEHPGTVPRPFSLRMRGNAVELAETELLARKKELKNRLQTGLNTVYVISRICVERYGQHVRLC